MTHKKARKSKIFTLFFSLIMCLAFIPSIAMASPTRTVYAEGTTFEYIEIKGDTDVTSTDGTYKYTTADKTLILKNYNGGQSGTSSIISEQKLNHCSPKRNNTE